MNQALLRMRIARGPVPIPKSHLNSEGSGLGDSFGNELTIEGHSKRVTCPPQHAEEADAGGFGCRASVWRLTARAGAPQLVRVRRLPPKPKPTRVLDMRAGQPIFISMESLVSRRECDGEEAACSSLREGARS